MQQNSLLLSCFLKQNPRKNISATRSRFLKTPNSFIFFLICFSRKSPTLNKTSDRSEWFLKCYLCWQNLLKLRDLKISDLKWFSEWLNDRGGKMEYLSALKAFFLEIKFMNSISIFDFHHDQWLENGKLTSKKFSSSKMMSLSVEAKYRKSILKPDQKLCAMRTTIGVVLC